MNIIGTGLSGLVGSRIVECLSPQHSFENLSLETGVDITNAGDVTGRIEASQAPWVFHFAAKTDVDGAQKEMELGEQSPTWIVNVGATQTVVEACKKTGKKLLYISSDYVFDGTGGPYDEEDFPHPLGWYATTKYEGEKRVALLGDQGLIIRIANPYRKTQVGKKDFVHKMVDRFSARKSVEAPSDQLFVPTFIDDIASAIGRLVAVNAGGVYHVVGSQALSPYEAAKKVARAFGYDETFVLPIAFASLLNGRAPRPFQTILNNDKIQKLGVMMHTFDEGLALIVG